MTKRRGSIFAIGGRDSRPENIAVLEPFVTICGGAAARLVIVTTASNEPERKRKEYQLAFHTLGIEELSFFHPERRTDAREPELLTAVERADAVFFVGGSQLKLITTLGGTPFETTLRERHRNGTHVGGTSAGAAAMSAVMIARGKRSSAARLSAVRMSPGFGFVPQVIIDQHFAERDRYGRLLAAVLCNPSMLGFGLDEATAVEFDPEEQVRVYGRGNLTIVDGSQLTATNIHQSAQNDAAAFADMRMHVLSEGWSFDLAQRRVVEPAALTAGGELVTS